MVSMDHMPKMHIFRDIACSKPNTLNRSSLALRSEASSASSPRFARLRSQLECIMYCLNRKQFDIELKFLNLPCHTQAVERHIRVVTEVSSRVSGQSQREGTIMTTLISRKKMPKFNLKSQFKVLFHFLCIIYVFCLT